MEKYGIERKITEEYGRIREKTEKYGKVSIVLTKQNLVIGTAVIANTTRNVPYEFLTTFTDFYELLTNIYEFLRTIVECHGGFCPRLSFNALDNFK